VLAAGSRNRRAGELLAAGTAAADIAPVLGQTAEAVDTVPLLADRAAALGVDAPALTGLADLIEGRVEPGAWTASLTAPPAKGRKARAA
jgi:glycerol-3-phosphate dehydrogenase